MSKFLLDSQVEEFKARNNLNETGPVDPVDPDTDDPTQVPDGDIPEPRAMR